MKRYCGVAAEAHIIDPLAAALIARVKGYSHKEGRNIDKERPMNERRYLLAMRKLEVKERIAQYRAERKSYKQEKRRESSA